MAHLRRTALAALAVALCAAPVAAADRSHEHGTHAAVVPVHKVAGTPAGTFIGENFARDYAGQPPPVDGPCPVVGNAEKALVMGPIGETVTCAVARRTQLVVFGLGAACSDAEEPPFFGADARAQRKCVIAFDHGFVQVLRVTVDGLAVDIRKRRFEVVSPQMTAQLPPDDITGVSPGTVTLVAHAWMAEVRKLSPGRHTVTVDGVTPDFSVTSTFILDVLRDR